MEFFIIEYDELVSSQTKIKELSAMDELENRTIILSKKQTGAYGRNKGSVWLHGENDLAFSLMIEDNTPNLFYHLPFIVALAITKAIIPIESKIKWPNDIMIDGKKVSGLIIDKIHNRYFIGIGINIKEKPEPYNYLEKYSQGISDTISRDILLQKFLKSFDNIYSEYKQHSSEYNSDIDSIHDSKNSFTKIRNMFLEKAFKLHEEISFNIQNEKITGIFEDIDENGAIILLVNGERKKFFYI